MNPQHWVRRFREEGWAYVDADPPVRDFAGKRGDCWTFVMHVEREQFGVELPDLYYASSQDFSDVNRIVEVTAPFAAECISRRTAADGSPCRTRRADDRKPKLRLAQPGDVVLLWYGGLPTHAAICAGRDCVLHLGAGGVCLDPLSVGRWHERVDAIYRPHR